MAKVLGIHEIDLRPGVTGEEFESFYREEAGGFWPSGWKGYLLKGDRGEREGSYTLLIEIESPEARDRIAPAHRELSEEAQREGDAHKEVIEKWKRLASFPAEDSVYTDYSVVAEQ